MNLPVYNGTIFSVVFIDQNVSVTNFVRKMRASLELAKEPQIQFNVQKIGLSALYGFLSSINDDFKRGRVTGDHSFKHGSFRI